MKKFIVSIVLMFATASALFAQDVMVTLNPPVPPRADKILQVIEYAHPLLDTAAYAAQQALPAIQGLDRVYVCGAWTGYGFHEDGLKSGRAVAAALLARQGRAWKADVTELAVLVQVPAVAGSIFTLLSAKPGNLTAVLLALAVELLLLRLGLWQLQRGREKEAQLQAVAHNGGESFRHARHTRALGLPVVRLPSTSPANAGWSFERKLAAWAEVLHRHGVA